MTTNISSDKVKYILSKNDVPQTGHVVIDFYADWCGPCKKLSPYFSELSNQYPTITFLKVNTDNAEELAQLYDVQALPTIVFIHNNNVISMIKGFNVDALKKEVEQLSKEN